MTAAVYNVTNEWSATNRYTAGSQIDALIIDPFIGSQGRIAWTTTLSDTVPTITPEQAAKLPQDGTQPLVLNSGERLWLAIVGSSSNTGTATLET
jgi:ligand-binding sensor domain-containing protein